MYHRKLCCKVPVVGPTGPQGATGPQGPSGATDNAILWYNITNIVGGDPAVALTYNANDTVTLGWGIERYLDSSNNITFSSVPEGNYLVEIYAHCDAYTNSAGTNNYITLELVRQSGTSGLSIIDIDTRSVQKGNTNHLTFGPSAYRLTGPGGTIPVNTIDRASTYTFRGESGIDYLLTELKLIIKVRPYV